MPPKSRTRVPNKTQWSLLDIVAHCRAGRGHWQQAMDKAERQWDPAMMALLARLRDNLAEIERAAKDALNGDYSTDKIEED